MRGGWRRWVVLAAVLTPPLASFSAAGPAAGAEAGVEVVDFAFSPASLTVVPGTVVRWTYSATGQARHTVTADDGSFDSGLLRPGRSFRRILSAAGAGTTIAYHCSIHPTSMRGELTVAAVNTTAVPTTPPTTLPSPAPTPVEPPITAAATTLVEASTTTTPPATSTTTSTQPPVVTSEPPAVNPFEPGDGTGGASPTQGRRAVPLLVAGIAGVLAAIAAVGRRLYQEGLTRPGQ